MGDGVYITAIICATIIIVSFIGSINKGEKTYYGNGKPQYEFKKITPPTKNEGSNNENRVVKINSDQREKSDPKR